ncbi:MAG: aminotransferase class I/II-fold pyridoxal phosphate-dependent enzyme [Caldilineaceae bacterium]
MRSNNMEQAQAGYRMIAGTTNLHKNLERALASFKGIEDVVLFQTGYAANTGTIPALVDARDWVVVDKQVHCSILEGVALSKAKFTSFRHSDPEHLQRRLETIRRRHKQGGILVVVEGVYGIDGDLPPLPALLAITRRYDARLLIDECHATGVLGGNGRGVAEHFNLTEPLDLVMDSLSKVLGSLGGWIGASKEVTDYLRYYAKPITFSVGLPAVNVASALAALQILAADPALTAQLQANAQFMRTGLQHLGIQSVAQSASAIMSIAVNDEIKVRKMTRNSSKQGCGSKGFPTRLSRAVKNGCGCASMPNTHGPIWSRPLHCWNRPSASTALLDKSSGK